MFRVQIVRSMPPLRACGPLGLLGLVGLLVGFPAASVAEDPAPRVLTEIAPGVLFAPQEHDRRFNDANVVFLVGSEGIVAVDAPSSAAFLNRALDALELQSEAPLRAVVNTHWHEDHTQGNAVYRERFGDSFEILGHNTLTTDVPQRAQSDFAATTVRWEAAIEAAEVRHAQGVDREGNELDEAAKAKLRQDIEETRELVTARHDTHFLAPSLTYSDRLTLDHSIGPIQLIHYRAHTRGDTVIYLPEQKILITGDLMDALPFGGHGYPREWISTLDELSKLDFETILPGHGGALEGRKHFDSIHRMLRDIVAHAEAAVAAGTSLEAAQKTLELGEIQQRLVDDERAQRNWDAFIPSILERAYGEAAGTLED